MIMSNVVEVEIDGKRYIPLLTLEKDAAGTIDLTTISSRQSQAKIKIFLCNDKRRLLREIEVKNISIDRAGAPVIMLQGMFTGRSVLTLKIMVNGRLNSRTNIRMKKHSRRRNKWLFIIMLLLLGAGIIFFSWLWLGRRKGKELPVVAVLPESVRKPKIENADQDQTVAAEPVEKDESETTEPLPTGQKAAEVGSVKSVASTEPVGTVEPPTAGKKPIGTEEPPTARKKPTGTVEPPAASKKPTDTVEPPTASKKPTGTVEPPAAGKKQTGTIEPPAGGKPVIPTEPQKSQELTLPENTIYFLPDSSLLTPAAEAKLRTLLPLFLGNSELEIEIFGHCAPMGNEQGRVNLSLERARSVYDFLIASGWKPHIAAKLNGAGSNKAVTRNLEKQHLNRRVEILIISGAD